MGENSRLLTPVAKKILLIDDEELLSWCISHELTNLGYEVRSAHDLNMGIKEFEVFKPHLIVCDQNLPDGRSLAMLNELKRRHPAYAAIIITAYTPPSKAEMIKIEAKICLSKPFPLKELTDIIDAHFVSKTS
ncbi:MAG: response regulator [Chitinophagaceae bacterium]|nr:response regulator [Oligoflexus sp.]